MSDKSVGECFQFNQDTREFVKAVEKRHGDEIQRLADRLPPWVTAVIGLLTLTIGVLATLASKCMG